MPKITPFLWFATEAEEAMSLYVSVFPRSRVVHVMRAQGRVISVQAELDGQAFTTLNGNPNATFTDATSFFVGCETQAEIDTYWDRLTADGGAPGRCGWLKDKFGVSWQIVPTSLGRLLGDPDPAKATRVLQAMLTMSKMDLAVLTRAHEGSAAD